MLAQPGHGIEDSALAGIGIARQRHHVVVGLHIDAQLDQVRHIVGGAGGAVRCCGGMSHRTGPGFDCWRLDSWRLDCWGERTFDLNL